MHSNITRKLRQIKNFVTLTGYRPTVQSDRAANEALTATPRLQLVQKARVTVTRLLFIWDYGRRACSTRQVTTQGGSMQVLHLPYNYL